VGRKPIPKSGFLDACEYLGYVYGARRWRRSGVGFLYTWDSLYGEVEVSICAASTWALLTL